MSLTTSSSSTSSVPSSTSSIGTIILTSNTLSSTPTSTSEFGSPPTFTGGPNNGNNNNNGNGGGGFGGNNGGNNGIASSAALYLYTFLATLVLLLSVSAAIVIRSFILRRRHRRMVEEAIRNGTWVPQNMPPSGRAPRVDLSKKPVMWEAYLGGGGIYRGAEKGGRDLASSYSYGGEKASLGGLDGAEWESIKPFSASLVHPMTHSGVNGSRGGLGSSASDDANDSASGVTGNRPSFVHRIGAGVRHIFRTTSSSPASPLPPNSNSTNVALNAGAHPEAGNAEGEGVVGELEKPPTVRVAVLIAMPTPPKPSSATSSSNVSPSPEGPSTSSMVLSPATSHPLSPSNSQQQPQASSSESEEPLPLLEMGVAEVALTSHDEDGGRLGGEMGRVPPGKEAVGRDSASMTVEV